jgi:hypothetical protein
MTDPSDIELDLRQMIDRWWSSRQKPSSDIDGLDVQFMCTDNAKYRHWQRWTTSGMIGWEWGEVERPSLLVSRPAHIDLAAHRGSPDDSQVVTCWTTLASEGREFRSAVGDWDESCPVATFLGGRLEVGIRCEDGPWGAFTFKVGGNGDGLRELELPPDPLPEAKIDLSLQFADLQDWLSGACGLGSLLWLGRLEVVGNLWAVSIAQGIGYGAVRESPPGLWYMDRLRGSSDGVVSSSEVDARGP